MLTYNPQFNIQDWLDYQAPYHQPAPRDDANYFNQLGQPANNLLFTALQQALRPFDGGKQSGRLDWLEAQRQTISQQAGRPAHSMPNARNDITDTIKDELMKPQLQQDRWIQAQQNLPVLLNQLSTQDLEAIREEISQAKTRHTVSYIRDCSVSYTQATALRQNITTKNLEIRQFLQSQIPPADTLTAYLARIPPPTHHAQGLRLQAELQAVENNALAVLYRIRQLMPVQNSALNDTLNRSGRFSVPIADINQRDAKRDYTAYLRGELMSSGASIRDILQNDPVILAVYNQVNTDSQGEIARLVDVYTIYFETPGNCADPNDVETSLSYMLDDIINEHPQLTQFYGIEQHKLNGNNGIYSVGSTGHTLDKNMVWILGNIHSGRRIRVNSPLELNNIMRQTVGFQDNPSAFANEVSALISVGYEIQYENGAYYFDPPRINGLIDTASLANVRLADLQQDMSSIEHKLKVLDNVLTALNQQHNIHSTPIQPLLVKYQNAADLNEVQARIEQQIDTFKAPYAMANPGGPPSLQDMTTYLTQRVAALQIDDPTGLLATHQADLDRLQDLERDLQSLPGLQLHQDRLNVITQQQDQVTATARTLCRDHHQVDQLEARLQVIQQHAAGQNAPPDIQTQVQNATQLRDDAQQLQQAIQGYHLTNINFPTIDAVQQDSQAAHQMLYQRQFADLFALAHLASQQPAPPEPNDDDDPTPPANQLS